MTSMWMLERADGTLLDFDGDNDPVFDDTEQGFASADKTLIESYRESEGGHLVELVTAKPKVPVSREEADMLKEAVKDDNFGAGFISDYVDEHWENYGSLNRTHIQDRLMQAYVNGYTVVEPTKYNVKVPKKWIGDDKHYWTKEQDGALTWAYLSNKDYMILTQQFTLDEIEHYGLGDCQKAEVSDD